MKAKNCAECQHSRPWERKQRRCMRDSRTVGATWVCDDPGEAFHPGEATVLVNTADGDAARGMSVTHGARGPFGFVTLGQALEWKEDALRQGEHRIAGGKPEDPTEL